MTSIRALLVQSMLGAYAQASRQQVYGGVQMKSCDLGAKQQDVATVAPSKYGRPGAVPDACCITHVHALYLNLPARYKQYYVLFSRRNFQPSKIIFPGHPLLFNKTCGIDASASAAPTVTLNMGMAMLQVTH
ncbi:hypothetical protein TrVFT333_011225 [Trichoderma virens FT-333]|nr:hypothetical protein TrVFT333_011225 [Trichoderma virens FT-333]